MKRVLLRVTAPHFVAGAVYEKQRRGDEWVCIRTAPILHWIIVKTPESVGNDMQRKGWTWEWLSCDGLPVLLAGE